MNQKDKEFAIFLELRVEEFAEFWADFIIEYKTMPLDEIKQVIYGLPIESLREWKRNHIK